MKVMQKRIICAAVFAVFAIIAVLVVSRLGKHKNASDNEFADNMTEADSEVEYYDAEKYLSEQGEIKKVTEVKKAKNTEKTGKVQKDFEDRGFSEYEITVENDISGEYLGSQTPEKGEKYPFYTTWYQAEWGETWSVVYMNGHILAYPISYNLNNPDLVPVVVTEDDVMVTYDSVTNSFYEWIPDESVLKIVSVKEINAKVLDDMNSKDWK